MVLAAQHVVRGWPGTPCPSCAEVDRLCINVHDGKVCCANCEAEWTAEELEDYGKKLLTLAAFLKTMPEYET